MGNALAFYGPAITEVELRGLASKGARIEILALKDTYIEVGTIKGEWRIDFISAEDLRYAVRLSQRSEVKIYKTPASIFNLCTSIGLDSANIPLKSGTSVALECV